MTSESLQIPDMYKKIVFLLKVIFFLPLVEKVKLNERATVVISNKTEFNGTHLIMCSTKESVFNLEFQSNHYGLL